MYADCIDHGSALADYDSRHDTATLIKTWGMPTDISSSSMYERMMNHIAATAHIRSPNHRKLKDTIIRIEASPTPEESKDWTDEDWAALADRVLLAMDDAVLKRKYKNFRKTNLKDTMGAVYLHKDSKSGILHLHFFMCRSDNGGHVNCGNHMGERAVAAADAINVERGWELPETIHKEHVKELTDLCYDILRNMERFRMDDYLSRIREKGYRVKTRESNGKVVGYTIMYGNSPLNASELSDKHSLTANNVEKTWAKLHNMRPKTVSLLGAGGERVGTTTIWEPIRSSEHSERPACHEKPKAAQRFDSLSDSFKPIDDFIKKVVRFEDNDYNVTIKPSVYELMKSEIEEPLEDAAGSVSEMLDAAILVFGGYIDAATKYMPSYGGGGGSNDLPKRKKDEDDERWARRCTAFVRTRYIKPRYRGRRR